jgi:hypothetical protein
VKSGQRRAGISSFNLKRLPGRLDAPSGSVYIRVQMSTPSDQRNACFRFLRRLRADGRTNMYGAVPYLMSRFSLNREAAFRMVCDWLDQQALPELPSPSTRRRKLPRGHAA